MLIRPLRSDEHETIISVIQDAFQAPPWNLIMPESEITPRLRMFEDGSRKTLVAVADEEIVGLIWFGIARPETLPADIVTFLDRFPADYTRVYCGATAVRLKHQGRGTGRSLTMAAHQVITDTYPQYVLYSRMRSDNPRIITLRESLGFKRTGIFEDHYGVKDEWWYKKP